MGCSTRVEALVHLGKHFRVVLPNTTDSDTDLEVRCTTCALRCFSVVANHLLRPQVHFVLSVSGPQVGEKLLSKCCFVHLESGTDKFSLLLEMLHKLYALVNLQCCEDNPDALTHHEILLPGDLLQKKFVDRVEQILSEMGQQVRVTWVTLGGCSLWPLIDILWPPASAEHLPTSCSVMVGVHERSSMPCRP